MFNDEHGHYLILHDLLAFKQHPDLICNFLNREAKTKWKKPRSRIFSRLRKGDRIVYYATKDSVIVGIFEIASDILNLENDEHWGSDVLAFRIQPWKLPPKGYFLDLKALARSAIRFDIFPKREIWYSYLQGHSTKALTANDFHMIERNIENTKYLVSQTRFAPTDTDWHQKLAWLRDLRIEGRLEQPVTFLKRNNQYKVKKY